MSILQAIILGIIQGLTEFIPISSTAHLTVAGTMMGLIGDGNHEQWTAFMAVIQLGTLAAVLIYFAGDIRTISTAFLRENLLQRSGYAAQSQNSKLGWMVILGSIPIVTIGFALKKIIEGALTKDLLIISIMLIAVSLVLIIAERMAKRTRTMDDLTWKDALAVGMAQVLALMPGSSRSGTTITAGLFLGMTRETAARFSFLLSIPAIFGSGVYEFLKTAKYLNADQALTLGVATVVSGISGYAAIAFLLRYLRSNSTMIFIVYRILAAIVILAFLR
ncbi:MAG: undecaprenyl-diphosphatase UppP [Candidatus Kapabacteria bacterium]|nr:undecaprenyl-diphosphatase UppP [Candidatus Kapabacteria bacterium]